MGLQRANTELVVVEWLKGITGIDPTKVGTTVPQARETWDETGWIQPIVVGSSPNFYVEARNPVITIHTWAVNLKAQRPPWGKANDLAERIVAALYDPVESRSGILTLGPAGNQVNARVLETWLLNEPHRVPSDQSDLAHYTMDIGMSWIHE